MGKKDKYNPDMVAEWLKALFPNSSRELPEGPILNAWGHQHLYGTVAVIINNLLQ